MTTAPFPTHHPIEGDAHGHDAVYGYENYLISHGTFLQKVWSWMTTVDHKRIGIMYLVSIMGAFGLGGLMAMLIRIELFSAGPTIMTAQHYNQVMTLHGGIMVFLFIIPSIPAALGNFFLPLMIGAKDVAFPKLNLSSYYIYVVGALFAVYSMVTGAADTGWTFYTPYSTDAANANSIVAMTLAAFILGFSSIFTGLNFIVTVHKMRAPGMTWFKMPLFVWAIYATAIIQVMATPVLGITLLLLTLERVAGVGIFDPLMGGDPVLYQHFFWFYSHPAVYIMILPGMGIISELITCYSRKPIFGYTLVAYSSVSLALIGFLVWGHHMFVSGQSEVAIMLFSALTFGVAVPSAVKVFNWLATMYRGSIVLKTGMLYALAFMFEFSIGGLTGLFLGTLGTDVHLHNTYFIVAHFHYVMMGGTVMAFLGGLHHWWPKMTGKMYPEKIAQIVAGVIFIGFNLTFFTQFILGSQGMPRRYFDYQVRNSQGIVIDQKMTDLFSHLHKISSVGAMILGIGFLTMLGYLVWSLFKGETAPRNPWGAKTLEWETATPPITYNFETPPVWNHENAYPYGVDPAEATVKA